MDIDPKLDEVHLTGSDGEVVASTLSYLNQAITFADIPAATITGFSLTSPDGQRVIGSLGATGEWATRTVHDCVTPDEGLIDDARWTCPDCAKVWEVHTEVWWAPVED